MFDEPLRAVCRRCGFSWEIAQQKRVRGVILCTSCKVRPAVSIQYGDARCIPWRGDFTLEDEPMLNGKLFMPGIRLCGHADCVNGQHLKLSED